jgi:hypothetical protein
MVSPQDLSTFYGKMVFNDPVSPLQYSLATDYHAPNPLVSDRTAQFPQSSMNLAQLEQLRQLLSCVNDDGTTSSTSTQDMINEDSDKEVCSFFMRTGICAYGDRCKFKHPVNRPQPTLTSRGYPVRPGAQKCAHFVKKGWCAFGLTCKFTHTEVLSPTHAHSHTPARKDVFIQSIPNQLYPMQLMSMSAGLDCLNVQASQSSGSSLASPAEFADHSHPSHSLFGNMNQQQMLATMAAPQNNALLPSEQLLFLLQSLQVL